MTEEKFSALIARLKIDALLKEKLMGASDLNSALAIVREAGFDLSEDDLIQLQVASNPELSEQELEVVSGGHKGITPEQYENWKKTVRPDCYYPDDHSKDLVTLAPEFC